MYKIALLDNENFVTEIQEVADLKDTIKALMLSNDDYVEITGLEIPAVESGYKLKYEKDSKSFMSVEYNEPIPDPTESELIQAELLLNQADILARQNEQDEVLAEILLNQMEV